MPNFKSINNINEITLNDRWTPATKFSSKDRVVTEKGCRVSSGYGGHEYRIIDKRERAFSTLERLGRGILGMVLVRYSYGVALVLKSVRNLFTKSKENIRFAVPEEKTLFTHERGKVVYIRPELLFNGAKISKDLYVNFALVTTSGKQKLVPVTGPDFGIKYTTYEGSALEALLKLAQDKESRFLCYGNRHYGSPIDYFLKHPHNLLITEDEFLTFILEKNEAGTPRICTLNEKSTLEVLRIIKEKKIDIDLHEKTAEGETLFTLWAGKGNAEITKLILELDPSVINQSQEQVQLAFVEAVLNGSKVEADRLLEAMTKEGIDLSEKEIWIQRAFKNDCGFSEEEFAELDQELKTKIFYAANTSGNEDIVKKLKPLGMDTVPLFWPGPSIIACNMDIVTTRKAIKAFLRELRQDGLLLTAEEFSQLDHNKYMKKVDPIGRIQGKKFIEKHVKENELKHIKVPEKIAVIKKGLENISFQVRQNLEVLPKDGQLEIYAERVEPVNRKLSLEEAIEFMIILEKTGYNDFAGENIFFCEDGIYFIDTEYKDFSPTTPPFEFIKSLTNYVDPKDAKKFLEEYEKRKNAYDKEKEAREAQQKAYRTVFESPYTKLTTGYAKHEFTFPVNSLGEVCTSESVLVSNKN